MVSTFKKLVVGRLHSALADQALWPNYNAYHIIIVISVTKLISSFDCC